ncbi:MAG: hypothetical protein JNJ49_16650 [Bdellovibrionaceae bacterium]|nr:hypothetical protein [Pseudobdellovibrionaceae bacterium]
MLTLSLHPVENRSPRHDVEFQYRRLASDRLSLTFTLRGGENVALGSISSPLVRRDELWKQTCFECFMANAADRGASARYFEWNLAPSGDWQAYGFTGYRQGRSEVSLEAPRFTRKQDGETFIFEFQLSIPIELQSKGFEIGVSAVVQELAEEAPFYWAFAHRAEKPDFHNREAMLVIVPDVKDGE